MRVVLTTLDVGRSLGLCIEIFSKRRAWRFYNPAWPIINWRWQRKHRA